MTVSNLHGAIARDDTTTARALRVCSQISRGASLVAATLALVGILGWALDSTPLASVSPRFPRLTINTAVAVLFASIALLAVERRGAGPLIRRAGQLAAGVVGLIGIATVIEYVGGVDLGIDRLLVPTGACREVPLCGRPSLNAAVALVLLSGSLLLVDVPGRRGWRPAQILAALVAGTSLAALAGYVYGATPLYRVPGYGPATGLSVHASVALTALAVGVLCARPREGAMRIVVSGHAGGALARRFLGAALLAVPLLGVLFTLGEEAGIYSAAMEAALISVTVMALSIAWVLRTARRLDASDRALRATEKRHRTFVEQASEPIFIADMTGHYVDVNRAACELLGYTREELIGLTIADLVPPEQLPILAEVRERLLSGASDRGEWSLRTKNGELVPVEVTASITPDGQWQASVRDIRERRRIEKIENDTVHRLAVMSEASLVFSRALADIPEQGFESVLRAIAEEARVATRADGATLAVALDPASSTPAMSLAAGTRDALAHGLTASVRIGGREIGTLSVAKGLGKPPFEVEDGTMLNALASRAALAIETARSYARETEGRARLQALLDNMPAGVAFVDAGGAPVHNRFLDEFVDGKDITRDDHPIQRALRARERVVERMALQKHDGTFVTMLVTAAPVSTSAASPSGAIATFQDISAIEELERFREDWNTIVAHELRQPLHSIGLAVHLLERDTSGEAAADAVRRVRTAARRLDRMLEDLSDVSRLDARRLKLARRPVHLAGLIRDIVERTGESVRITELGARPPSVMLDALRIDQVLSNLLSNAAKYRRPATPIDVVIDWREDELLVSVTNENAGPGISEEDAERIFDRFTRTEASSQSGVPGLGVGLYISRRLVEAHGGTIALDRSRADRTSFRITLPIELPAQVGSGLHLVDAPQTSHRQR